MLIARQPVFESLPLTIFQPATKSRRRTDLTKASAARQHRRISCADGRWTSIYSGAASSQAQTQFLNATENHTFSRCKCKLCAPHLSEASPQGSEDLDESSDSESPDEIAIIASALADSSQSKIDQQQRCGPATAASAAVSSASLREQKREAIRKAVEIQRAEMDRGQKH